MDSKKIEKLTSEELEQVSGGDEFNGCPGPDIAPGLPATTLQETCCENMFEGGSGLKPAPELPANTLAPGTYHGMLGSLTAVKCTNPACSLCGVVIKTDAPRCASCGGFLSRVIE